MECTRGGMYQGWNVLGVECTRGGMYLGWNLLVVECTRDGWNVDIGKWKHFAINLVRLFYKVDLRKLVHLEIL